MGRYILIFFALLGVCYVPVVQDGGLVPRQILLAAGALAGLFFLPKDARKSLPLAWPEWAFLGLIGWQALSTAWSVNLAEALALNGRWVALAAWYLLLRAAFTSGVLTMGQMATALAVYFATDLLFIAFQFLALVAKDQLFEFVQRIRGSHGNKNLLSASLALTLPWYIYGWRQKGWLSVMFLFLIAFSILLIGLLQTRAAWLGIAFGGAFGLLLYVTQAGTAILRQRVVWAGTIGIVVLAGLWLSIMGLPMRLARVESIQERIDLWRNSRMMLAEAPLLGKGAGQWQIWFPSYGLGHMSPNVQRGLMAFQRPHNDFLWIACELGLVGLALFLVFFGGAIARLWHLRSRLPFAAGLGLASLVGYGIMSAFDFPRERPELQLIWLIWPAWTFSQQGASRKGSLPTLWMVAGLAFLGLVHGIPRFSEERQIPKIKKATYYGRYWDVTRAYKESTGLLLSVDATTVPVAWYVGILSFQAKDYEGALRYYQEAREDAPFGILTINNLGTTFGRLNQPDSAKACYRRVLAYSPHWDEPLINLGAIELREPGGGTRALELMRQMPDTVLDTRWPVFKVLTMKAALMEAREKETPAYQARIDSLLADGLFPNQAYALYRRKNRAAQFWR